MLNDKFTPPYKIFGRHEKVQIIKYLPKNIITIPIVAVIIYRHKLLLLLKMHKKNIITLSLQLFPTSFFIFENQLSSKHSGELEIKYILQLNNNKL